MSVVDFVYAYFVIILCVHRTGVPLAISYPIHYTVCKPHSGTYVCVGMCMCGHVYVLLCVRVHVCVCADGVEHHVSLCGVQLLACVRVC